MPDNTPATPAKKIVKVTQYSARRALCQIGNKVYIYRLRRPSEKSGEQKVRDLQRTLTFKTDKDAEVGAQLIMAQAQERRFGVAQNDDTEYELSK